MGSVARSGDQLERLAADPWIRELVAALESPPGGDPWVVGQGRSGSSSVFLAAAIQSSQTRPLLLIRAHLDEADEAVEELRSLGVEAERFPAMELLPGESGVRLDLISDRLSVVRRLAEHNPPDILVAPVAAIMQAVPDSVHLGSFHRILKPRQEIAPDDLVAWLVDAGYVRVQALESPGEFALRGDILDVFPGGGMPARLDFFGDVIEAMHEIDLATMGSDRRLERVDLVAAGDLQSMLETPDGEAGSLISLLTAEFQVMIDDWTEVSEQARSYLERVSDATHVLPLSTLQQQLQSVVSGTLAVERPGHDFGSAAVPIRVGALPSFSDQAGEAFTELGRMATEQPVLVWLNNEGDQRRFEELLLEFVPDSTVRDRIERVKGYVHRGFCWGRPDQSPVVWVPYHELIHRYQLRRRVHRADGHRARDAFVDVQPGDFVVHREHGIASFLGLQLMGRADGESLQEEFLTLEFAKGARLHVPASEIELVQRYVGGFHGTPDRSLLGGKRWHRQKAQAGESVRDLATRMLELQAVRAGRQGWACGPDQSWQQEFEAAFPYEETEDQISAIAAVKTDLETARPMDRLICGDVGFGKTEVAIRAAFKVVQEGRQVAVLVPTTVLAEQHGRTFASRFAGYPITVESLSRFKNRAQQQAILDEVASGSVDVVIGTHRLLSRDVNFAELGLVVIDEEQRFGVEHKQQLIGLRSTVDVLTMTATPIPRTLHMSMLGLRDISSLTTPPADRRAVVTEVLPWNPQRLGAAIQRELAREGQIFVVHNRVSDLEDVAGEIRRLAPDARVVTGHGQMPPAELESVMLQFMRHDADILVATTIIESGIDIPNANTIIINEADRFGLSDLHQLRGRVGRFKHRAYCYLLLPLTRSVNEDAKKRLRAIENFSMLGAGFRIAMQDLEIRGAGNLLGAEQSGHIAAVGYDLYCQLLEIAVRDLREEPVVELERTVLDLGFRGYLPAAYIPAESRRMDAYRRIARAGSVEELRTVEDIVTSAYGPLPTPARRMWDLAELRLRAATAGLIALQRREGDLVFRPRAARFLPELEDALAGLPGSVRLVGVPESDDCPEVYWRPPARTLGSEGLPEILDMLRDRLGKI